MSPAPDGGEVFRVWAESRPLLGEVVGDRIATKLQSDRAAIRYTVVSTPPDLQIAASLVQVDCWGPRLPDAEDDGTASHLARLLRSEIEDYGPYGAVEGGWCIGAAVDNGPFEANDPNTGRPRHIVQVRVVTAPNPT